MRGAPDIGAVTLCPCCFRLIDVEATLRLTLVACVCLVASCLFMPSVFAQSADETTQSLAASAWTDQDAAHRTQRPNLTGMSWAVSVAGDAYTLSGDRLRLPGAAEGWEEDIALGVGVFHALGQSGHVGAGVGVGEDEDVAVRAHMAVKW
jgi:hypothetical protein